MAKVEKINKRREFLAAQRKDEARRTDLDSYSFSSLETGGTRRPPSPLKAGESIIDDDVAISHQRCTRPDCFCQRWPKETFEVADDASTNTSPSRSVRSGLR